MFRCLIALIPSLLVAAVGPESTLLAINGASPASLAVGNAWMALRHIPLNHVVVLRAVPPGSHCSRSAFIAGILDPLRTAVRERGLASQIALVAFAPDFPLAINMGLSDVPPEVGSHGSLTGMMALGSLVLAGTGEWTSLRANTEYQTPEGLIIQPIVPRNLHPEIKAVAACLKAKDYATAETKLLALDQQVPGHAGLLYDLACTQAQLLHPDAALATLTRAVDCGFTDGKWMSADPDLVSLHERAEFTALVTRLATFSVKPPTTAAFVTGPRWLSDVTPDASDRDLLPTMLLGVTSGDGLGVEATIANLTRAVGADGSKPSGTVYCARNGDVRSTTREWAFATVTKTLADTGVTATVIDGVLPKDAPAVAGAVVGSAGFAWADAHSTIVPGAICEHLTSFGGQLWPGAGQTHLTEWLRHGAAGTSGTVDEPFAIQAKFPSPFIHLHYARGLSLIEAFYRSVSSPYQLLIVGEPLCAPWAKPISVNALDPTRAPDSNEMARVEVWLDGHRYATVAPGAPLPASVQPTAGDHDLRLICLPIDATRQPLRILRSLHAAGPALHIVTAPTVALGDTVSVQASMAEATRLRLRGIDGVLAESAGATATLTCPTHRLGLGPVALLVEALAADGTLITQASLTIAVSAPPRLPAINPPAAPTPGPLVTVDGTAHPLTADSEGDTWLKESGLTEHAGSVEAWFRHDHDGLWQAQWLGTRVTAIAIDDQPEVAATPDAWLLLDLAAGWHRVRITVATGPGPCTLRIGSDGTWPLSTKNCVHP